jgi:hypothetical protein
MAANMVVACVCLLFMRETLKKPTNAGYALDLKDMGTSETLKKPANASKPSAAATEE